jgi:hypothetical protein
MNKPTLPTIKWPPCLKLVRGRPRHSKRTTPRSRPCSNETKSRSNAAGVAQPIVSSSGILTTDQLRKHVGRRLVVTDRKSARDVFANIPKQRCVEWTSEPIQMAIFDDDISISAVANNRGRSTDKIHKIMEGSRKVRSPRIDHLLGDAGQISKIGAEYRIANRAYVAREVTDFRQIRHEPDRADLHNLPVFSRAAPIGGERSFPSCCLEIEHDDWTPQCRPVRYKVLHDRDPVVTTVQRLKMHRCLWVYARAASSGNPLIGGNSDLGEKRALGTVGYRRGSENGSNGRGQAAQVPLWWPEQLCVLRVKARIFTETSSRLLGRWGEK